MNQTRKMRFYPQGHEKIKWKIPGLFYNDKILFALYDACKELKIKEPFQAVFGSVTSRWCGGRISPKLSITNDEAQNIIKEYCLRFLVLFVPIIISAILNVICFKSFGNGWIKLFCD